MSGAVDGISLAEAGLSGQRTLDQYRTNHMAIGKFQRNYIPLWVLFRD